MENLEPNNNKTVHAARSREEQVPMPPTKPLFMPLDFWLNLISYLDKRVEIVSLGSGYGTLEMSIKLQRGKIFEVEFEEKIRLRDVLEKAGHRGVPLSTQQTKPTL